jgi:predicted nucleic acid-binding protein
VALIAQYLIDTSAAARMRDPGVRARLEPLITGGVVATCATLDAEALYSARRSQEYDQIRADRHDAYEYVPTDDEHWHELLTLSAYSPAPAGIAPSASPTCSLLSWRLNTA